MVLNAPLTFSFPYRIPMCQVRFDRRVVGFHLHLVTEGSLKVMYDEKAYTLFGGTWFWPTYPGPRIRFHAARGDGYWFHRHVGFQGAQVLEWIDAKLWLQTPQCAPEGEDWGTRFDAIIVQATRPDRWGQLRATSLLETLLLELAEARNVPPPSAPVWLEAVIAALETGGFVPNYAAIAAGLGISLSALRRRFLRETGGLGLHEYVILRRIRYATELLEQTEEPLRVIAEAVGYESEYFFSRQFRQYVSIAPGEYRRSLSTK